jgi:DNA-binding NtrC family response regulator
MPQPTEGTIILKEVANLTPGEQALVLKLLTERNQTLQVVSTSSEALFPLVERGIFDDALYYRLNVVRLTI